MTVTIRPLREDDLDAADRIFRVAFGTFLGLPEPAAFGGDSDYVRSRWAAAPDGALAAERDGVLVGSNFATRWGTYGFFGPLTVQPALWDQGIARRLLDATADVFAAAGTRHTSLFTFAHSPKHVALYQRYGYWPAALTTVLLRPVHDVRPELAPTLESLVPSARETALAACRQLTGALYPGFDPTSEIAAIGRLGLGDVVVLGDGRAAHVDAFAVCHVGAGTEAGSGTCYVKLAAVAPDRRSGETFERLLDALLAHASARGARQLVAGVSTARRGAYRALLARGFRSMFQGVAMHRPDEPAFDHPDAWVLDDRR